MTIKMQVYGKSMPGHTYLISYYCDWCHKRGEQTNLPFCSVLCECEYFIAWAAYFYWASRNV